MHCRRASEALPFWLHGITLGAPPAEGPLPEEPPVLVPVAAGVLIYSSLPRKEKKKRTFEHVASGEPWRARRSH